MRFDQSLRLTTALVLAFMAGSVLAETKSSNGQNLPSGPRKAPGEPMRVDPKGLSTSGMSVGSQTRSVIARRQLRLDDIKVRPTLKLGAATLDFEPFLKDPQAPFNIATRLKALPDAARVAEDKTDIVEVDQGLLVKSKLSYRIDGKTCANPQRRAQLAQAGAPCFARQTLAQKVAELSRSSSGRFIEDQEQRSTAARHLIGSTEQMDRELGKSITRLRQALADPQQRTDLIKRLGAAETARLEALSDSEIEDELVNSAEVTIETDLFIPREESFAPLGLSKTSQPVYDSPAMRRLAQSNLGIAPKAPVNLGLGPIVVLPSPPSDGKPSSGIGPAASKPMPSFVFLTGFTLGREHEWAKRITVTIDPCGGFWLDSCKISASVEPFARFSYGFGLRFPIEVSGTYSAKGALVRPDTAEFTMQLRPIDGGPAQYISTQLPSDQLFRAQELVAEVGAGAGVRYDAPILGSGEFSFELRKDLTDYLPGNLAGGQLAPPAPGGPAVPLFRGALTQLDLLGNQASFGIAGAKVHPAVAVDLESGGLSVKLTDLVSGQQQIVSSTEVNTVAVDKAGLSRISISDPIYNLYVVITPGVEAHTYLDLGVWSRTWQHAVWFPEISIELPPGGVDFACHADTVCNRVFEFQAWQQRPIDQRVKLPPVRIGN